MPKRLQALAKRLDHANWKERNAALEAMEEMVKAAGGRITPSLGEVMPALKVRRGAAIADVCTVSRSQLASRPSTDGRPKINSGARLQSDGTGSGTKIPDVCDYIQLSTIELPSTCDPASHEHALAGH